MSFFFFFLCVLVVIFLCEYDYAIEGIYYAWKEGMTNGDFAFIMYEQSRDQISRRLKSQYQWFASSWYDGSRAPAIEKAMRAALVLGPVTLQRGYNTFAMKLKNKMAHWPFFSDAYLGNMTNGKAKNLAKVRNHSRYFEWSLRVLYYSIWISTEKTK